MKNNKLMFKTGLLGLIAFSFLPSPHLYSREKNVVNNIKFQKSVNESFNEYLTKYHEKPFDITNIIITYDDWFKAKTSNKTIDKIKLFLKVRNVLNTKDLSYELLNYEQKKEYNELWEIYDLKTDNLNIKDLYERILYNEVMSQRKHYKDTFDHDFDFDNPSIEEKVLIFLDIHYSQIEKKQKEQH